VTDVIDTQWIGALPAAPSALRFSAPFLMAGVEWLAPADARIELRARLTGGRWTPWTLASVQGHDADGGVAPAPVCFGEPVWTGNASELQLRSDHPVEGLSVHVVSTRVRRQAAAPRPSTAVASRSAATAATTVDGYPAATPVLPAGPGQPPIIARRAWAGLRGGSEPPAYGDVRLMFVHHSVNANGYSAGEVPAMLLAIYQFHRYVRGWNDIGYNFAIDAYGRIWEAREGGIDQAVVGAQAGGYNLESAGVVMLGTFTAALPSAAALAALVRLLAWKLALHGVPVSGDVTVEVDPTDAFYTRYRPGQRVVLTRISGHRQGCSTDCPGDALFAHLPVIRSAAAALIGADQVTLALAFGAGQAVTPADYLDLAAVTVTAGDPVSLTGRLATQSITGTPGEPVAAAALEIESLLGQTESVVVGAAGSLTTGPLTSVVTDAEGRFNAEFSPRHNLLLRALHRDAPAVASPLLAVGVAPAVTLTLAGQHPLVVSGTVTPPKPTLELAAFDAAGVPLTDRQVVEVPADGSFRVAPKLPAGARSLRAVARADAFNVAGRSPRLDLTA
jgi:hypothetical protein